MSSKRDTRRRCVLITGGCGFIGSHIVEAFLASSHFDYVVAASRNPSRNLVKGAKYMALDITNQNQVRAILDSEQPDVIIHTVTPGVYASMKDSIRVTYEATKMLIECATSHPNVRALVYTSSCQAVSGINGLGEAPMHESSITLNTLKSGPGAYSRTKGATSSLVLASSTGSVLQTPPSDDFTGQLATTVLYIGSLYGERDIYTVPQMLDQTKNIGTRVQMGDDSALFDWVYAPNAAYAHVLAAEKLLDSSQKLTSDRRVDGEGFFITDDDPKTLYTFARALWSLDGDRSCLEGRKPLVIPMTPALFVAAILDTIVWILSFGNRPGAMKDALLFMKTGMRFSIDKAKATLDYKPLISSDQGLRNSVEWYRSTKVTTREKDE